MIVNSEGISLDSDRVTAILAWEQPKNIEGDMEKWSHDKPRFNKILENLSENLDQGKIFKKPKDKKENEKNKNKSVLSFEYEDI